MYKTKEVMYHFVYETTNTVNGKKYIGKHSSKTLNDSYLGSGIAITKAIEKYGKEAFKRKILKQFKTPEEALEYEAIIVTKDIVNDKNYYNMREGGEGGNYEYTDEDKSKMSLSAKIRILRDGHSLLGKSRTQQSKERLSETNKRRYKEDPTCHGRYGKSVSEESRLKMSISAKKRKRSEEETKRFGLIFKGSSWWNNGLINKRIKAGEEAPENFVKGRITIWQ